VAAPAAHPGAEPISGASLHAITAALQALPEEYVPRTRHRLSDGRPRYTNRLILEGSPYLRQHAHNPVNWYPWGDEAFDAARLRDVPVLLSVGYSTCHWCHVMEEESFEDEEIAALLNTRFVAVKVDREERPDVDAVYMAAVHRLTGRGGWPMTVFLTPDREPFYGGTYFPARDGDRGARIGFLTLLERMVDVYSQQRSDVAGVSAELRVMISGELSGPPPGEDLPGLDVIDAAVQMYTARYDSESGGLRGAPKFPSSLPVRVLLRHHRRTGEPHARVMASHTLMRMAAGGMFDQVGGGFHRYSTDARWLVPHFEKMLYNNALLVLAYLEGHQVTGDPGLASVARRVLDYIAREMQSVNGGFFSATDADSLTPNGHREEGWYFTWTPEELREGLGSETAARFSAFYGVTRTGNFEGRTILHVSRPVSEVASELGLSATALEAEMTSARETLLKIRSGRPAPLRDEKILAGWNGLMISAFARGSLVLGDAELARRAAAAANFVLEHMFVYDQLRRSHVEGLSRHAGLLEDHAFLIQGLLDLFEATGEARWLQEALALERAVEARFADPNRGGWFRTPSDGEALLARERPSRDGAIPSGTSVQILNLLRIAQITTAEEFTRRAEAALRGVAVIAEREPTSLSELLLAIDWRAGTPTEILIVTPKGRGQAEPLLAELRQVFLPNSVLIVAGEAELPELRSLTPLVRGKRAIEGRATAYVCEQGRCELPTSEPAVFRAQLAARSRASVDGREGGL